MPLGRDNSNVSNMLKGRGQNQAALAQLDAQILEMEVAIDRDLSFRQYTRLANPRFTFYRHNEVLAEALEAVVQGQIKRLMVFEPPRHGKSEQTSRLFPGYVLRRHPDWWVGLASYGADLAYGMSRNARANYLRTGGMIGSAQYGLKDGVETWQTSVGGGMWAAGVGGAQTGKGFQVGIVDDPIKNAEEAASPVMRKKHVEWWRSTFYTRCEPGAAIVLTQTRWDEGDLSGWLLSQEDEPDYEEGRQNWHIICLSAIRDKKVYQWPASCTVAPDWREEGEALCPERYPAKTIRGLMASVGPYWSEALYQQRPSSVIGKGRVYHCFDSDNVHDLPNYRKPISISGRRVGDHEVWIGQDFNVNPMAAVIARRVSDQLHVYDEVLLENANTEIAVREYESRYKKLGSEVNMAPDPAGRQRKTSAPVGQTDFSIIRQAGFNLWAHKAAPSRVDRYNAVNTLLGNPEDPDSVPRLFIDPRCRKLIEALQRLVYRPDTSQPDEGGGYTHITDALGYLVWWLFPIRFSRAGEQIRISR